MFFPPSPTWHWIDEELLSHFPDFATASFLKQLFARLRGLAWKGWQVLTQCGIFPHSSCNLFTLWGKGPFHLLSADISGRDQWSIGNGHSCFCFTPVIQSLQCFPSLHASPTNCPFLFKASMGRREHIVCKHPKNTPKNLRHCTVRVVQNQAALETPALSSSSPTPTPLQVEHVSVPFVDAFSLVVDDPFETSHLFCKQRPAAAAILPNTQKYLRIKSNIPSLITDDCNPSTGLSCKKEKRRNMLCTLQTLVQTFDPSSEFLLAFYPLFWTLPESWPTSLRRPEQHATSS